jgi:hypothetical protein
MADETKNPQINISKIPMGAGIGGAIAAVSMMLVILTGIPVLWYLLPPAIVVGCGVALVLRYSRHKTPGAPWILPTTER